MSNENTTTTTHEAMRLSLARATQEEIIWPVHSEKRARLTRDAGNLLDLRRRSGLTQARFAAAIGVSRGALANWENDRRPLPRRLAAYAGRAMRRVDWGYELTCEPIGTATGRLGLRTRAFNVYQEQVCEMDLPALKRNEGAGKGSRYR